ncbi:MAG: c-type cytochrome [Sulfitobacter sp.]
MNKAVLVVVALALGAGAASVWMQQGSAPVAGSEAVSEAAIEPGAPMVQVTLPEALSGQAQIGQRVFEGACASCHGINAAGREGTAPPLVHKIYEPSHHGDEAFYRAAELGVRSHHWQFGDMPPVAGLTRADVSTIIAYVRAVQQANGIN